jgi:hypothetical protein
LVLKIDIEKSYDRVRWTFLEQVMIEKGFPKEWISWVKGEKVCVNVNGERSPYFRTFRGLRQGDHLSPLLFNLVADALGVLLNKAIQKGHIKGVLEDLILGGVSHIQYADDSHHGGWVCGFYQKLETNSLLPYRVKFKNNV